MGSAGLPNMADNNTDMLVQILNATDGTKQVVERVEQVLFDILEVLKRMEEHLKQE